MPVLKPLSGSAEAPRQHSQPSRKGKKAWRKHVDVTEVEKGLEELNEQIIQGGVVTEKDSKDLFTLDITGDKSLHNKVPTKVRKALKADEIINQRSAVGPVALRKRPADRLGDGLVTTKRQRTDWVSHKELAKLRSVADGHHTSTVTVDDARYDLWDGPDEGAQNQHASKSTMLSQPVKAPSSIKQPPVSLAANKKPIPAVKKPSGGYSYNPTFYDYEDRLVAEGAKAVEVEKKRLAEEEADQALQEAAARSAAEAEAAEARAELSEWDEDSEWEGFQSGAEEFKNPATKVKRKTKAHRNRIERHKEEERRRKHEAKMRAKEAQTHMIKKLAQDVAAKEQEKALARVEGATTDSESEGDEDKLRRRRLGKIRLPEKDLELVLPEELQDSLRLLKPEGNLLKDRYRSLLVRGKMEARRHIPFRKKAKTKTTEKWSHKDFALF